MKSDDVNHGASTCTVCPDASEPTTYLTLGDGDFTYSLDLARYLALSKERSPVKLILSGIDTLEALTAKYKDAPSILEEIRTQKDYLPSLTISIQHGVNAIVSPGEISDTDDKRGSDAADHVLFHHPHLGTENCTLHQRFLAHMFHSATNHWMKEKGGIFHLTLVEGQYDRWKCQKQAERHGLELLHQAKFSPPPIKTTKKNGTSGTGNRYHYRRHQTGKSFGNRRPNSKSVTYTFGRAIDKGKYVATYLPWQGLDSSSSSGEVTATESKSKEPLSVTSSKQSTILSCPFCEKEFSEKRSLKCHLRDKHPNEEAQQDPNRAGPSRKRKKMGIDTTIEKSNGSTHLCPHCPPSETDEISPRIFQSAKALEAHIRAKHSGINTYIAPDWSVVKKKETEKSDHTDTKCEAETKGDGDQHEECPICGLKLVGRSLFQHFQDFVPGESSQTFTCDFCSKSFRDERAKLQHMNFCSKRPNTTKNISLCCPDNSWGPLISASHRGQEQPRDSHGSILTLGDTKLPCYYVAPYSESQTPPSAAPAIVIFMDIYGPSQRFIDIADRLARRGYHTIIPDFFHGKTIRDFIPSQEEEKSMTPQARTSKIMEFASQFPIESVIPDINTVFDFLNKEKKVDPNRIGGYGFCWGAWAVAKIASLPTSTSLNSNDGTGSCAVQWECAVCPHPSHTRVEKAVFHRDEVAMCRQIEIPMLLLVGQNDDQRLHPPVSSSEGGSEFVTQLRKHGGDSILFETMIHGWVSRGDHSQPEVKEQIESALKMADKFFHDHLHTSGN